MPKLKQQFLFNCWLTQSLQHQLQHLRSCEEIPEYLVVADVVLVTSCSGVYFFPLVPECMLLPGLSSTHSGQEQALGFISVLLLTLDWNYCCLLLVHRSAFLNIERWHRTFQGWRQPCWPRPCKSCSPSGFYGVSFFCFCLFFSNWNLPLLEFGEWNFNC